MRGLWIGAIGLRYVSGEIDYQSLHYSDYFLEYFERKVGSFDDFIERLERMCSVIFAYTFLLFFFFLSFILFLMEVVILARVMEFLTDVGWEDLGIFILFIFILMGIVVFIDFIAVFGNYVKEWSLAVL